MTTAEETGWTTHPMPELNKTLPLGLLYHGKQLLLMQRGLKPREMEDKWFIYWKDDELHFHRSWTGFCIYIVRFEVEGMGAKAIEVVINRDAEQYGSTDDKHDVLLVAYLINVLLLRRPARFPARHKDRTKAALEMWSEVGRAGLGVHPDDWEELN